MIFHFYSTRDTNALAVATLRHLRTERKFDCKDGSKAVYHRPKFDHENQIQKYLNMIFGEGNLTLLDQCDYGGDASAVIKRSDGVSVVNEGPRNKAIVQAIQWHHRTNHGADFLWFEPGTIALAGDWWGRLQAELGDRTKEILLAEISNGRLLPFLGLNSRLMEHCEHWARIHPQDRWEDAIQRIGAGAITRLTSGLVTEMEAGEPKNPRAAICCRVTLDQINDLTTTKPKQSTGAKKASSETPEPAGDGKTPRNLGVQQPVSEGEADG